MSSAHGDGDEMEDWLGKLALADVQTGGDRFFAMPAEIVSNVVEGLEGAFFEMTADERHEVLIAHQFFKVISTLRQIASDWAPRVCAAA